MPSPSQKLQALVEFAKKAQKWIDGGCNGYERVEKWDGYVIAANPAPIQEHATEVKLLVEALREIADFEPKIGELLI